MNILQTIYTFLGILFYIGLVSFVIGYCFCWGWCEQRKKHTFNNKTVTEINFMSGSKSTAN